MYEMVAIPVVIVVGFIIPFCLGAEYEEGKWQRKLIKSGLAEWGASEKGEPIFRLRGEK